MLASTTEPTAPETRRNFLLNVTDGVLFSAGTGFFSHAGLVPLFVATLTDARWPLGLVTPVLMVGIALPQLFGAAVAARCSDFWGAVRLSAWLPRLWVMALAAVPFVPQPWTLAVFFAVWALYALSLGFCIPMWSTFIAQVIPASVRGRFFGIRTAIGAVMAMAGATAASAVLAGWPGHLGFAACFAIAAVLLVLSVVSFQFTRHDWTTFDARRAEASGSFWQDALATLRTSSAFRQYLLARICTTMTVAATGFYAVHAVTAFRLDVAQASLLALAIVFVPNVTAALWGLLADRVGNRWVQIPVMVAAGAANVVLAQTPALPAYVACLVVAGLATVLNNMIDQKYMMELDPDRCGTLLGVLNLALTPWLLVLPLGAGVLAEFVGVPAVFLATGGALWCAAAVLASRAR